MLSRSGGLLPPSKTVAVSNHLCYTSAARLLVNRRAPPPECKSYTFSIRTPISATLTIDCLIGSKWAPSTSLRFVWATPFRLHLLAHWEGERAAWLRYHPVPWTGEIEREYHADSPEPLRIG